MLWSHWILLLMSSLFKAGREAHTEMVIWSKQGIKLVWLATLICSLERREKTQLKCKMNVEWYIFALKYETRHKNGYVCIRFDFSFSFFKEKNYSTYLMQDYLIFTHTKAFTFYPDWQCFCLRHTRSSWYFTILLIWYSEYDNYMIDCSLKYIIQLR